MHLLDEEADRFRIVVEGSPARRRLFEARVPKDATAAELEAFGVELARIVARKRTRDAEITKNDRGPREPTKP